MHKLFHRLERFTRTRHAANGGGVFSNGARIQGGTHHASSIPACPRCFIPNLVSQASATRFARLVCMYFLPLILKLQIEHGIRVPFRRVSWWNGRGRDSRPEHPPPAVLLPAIVRLDQPSSRVEPNPTRGFEDLTSQPGLWVLGARGIPLSDHPFFSCFLHSSSLSTFPPPLTLLNPFSFCPTPPLSRFPAPPPPTRCYSPYFALIHHCSPHSFFRHSCPPFSPFFVIFSLVPSFSLVFYLLFYPDDPSSPFYYDSPCANRNGTLPFSRL